MKKKIAVIMTMLTLVGSTNLTAFADETLSADVYVTISDQGTLAVAQEKITVTDMDNSGTLTIDEALYAAHEAKYEGGAAAGYNSYMHEDYGLSLGKLWGDNSGNFGYYVNNASAWSLADTVKDGDSLTAFVYADGEYYSDIYCWFDITSINADAGKEISITLSGAGYDADWNPVTVPVEGATITVNGEKTPYKTDSEGKAVIKIEEGGNYVISAVSDTQTLVPPVCKVNVSAATVKPADDTKDVNDTETVDGTGTLDNNDKTSPETGDVVNTVIYAVILMMGLAIIVFSVSRKKAYEK